MNDQYLLKNEALSEMITEKVKLICEKPSERFSWFKEFGAEVKKISDKKQFMAALHKFWTEVLSHEKNWAGRLFVSDDYRRDPEKTTYNDINYAIRNAWAWGMLYPDEAQQYFTLNADTGLMSYSEVMPKTRLLEKEVVSVKTKNETGAFTYTLKKPFPSHQIKSGFTYEQMQWVFDYLTVGLFTFEARVIPKVVDKKDKGNKAVKKPSSKSGKPSKNESDHTLGSQEEIDYLIAHDDNVYRDSEHDALIVPSLKKGEKKNSARLKKPTKPKALVPNHSDLSDRDHLLNDRPTRKTLKDNEDTLSTAGNLDVLIPAKSSCIDISENVIEERRSLLKEKRKVKK